MSVDVSISVRRLERIFRPSIFPAIRTCAMIPRKLPSCLRILAPSAASPAEGFSCVWPELRATHGR
jgi:hypothetical protein